MRSLLFFWLITGMSFLGFGQTYHFPDTVRYFTKTTDFGTVHGYLEIVNDSGDTVPMKWISRRGPTCPPEWNFNFDDQNNFYGTVQHLDSASFNMNPPGSFNQKMIIGLAHNGEIGIGSIFFTIFPEEDRADSTVIEFYFTITQGDTTDTVDTTSAIRVPVERQVYSIYWVDELHVSALQKISELVVFDLTGNLLHHQRDMWPGLEIRIHTEARAVIVETRSQQNVSRKKIGKLPLR